MMVRWHEALRRSSSAASSVLAIASASILATPLPHASVASAGGDSKSYTAGYDIRRLESEWLELLSPSQ
jgi:hypothetical protein